MISAGVCPLRRARTRRGNLHCRTALRCPALFESTPLKNDGSF